MKAFVIGVAHEVQEIGERSDSFHEEQKHYRRLILDLIAHESVTLIGEEAAPKPDGRLCDACSFAEDAARARGIEYLSLDIPPEVKKGILHVPHFELDCYTGRQVDRIAECNRYAIAWTRVREYHMGKKFLRDAIVIKRPSVSMLICGDKHAFRIARLLGQSQPESVEAVLRRRADYRGGHPRV